MVQLRSELEALDQCRIDPTIHVPAWHLDTELRARLDGSFYETVVEWMGSVGQKVLVIGASCPEFSAQLASRNMFVTVMDDDAGRIQRAQALSNEQGGMGTVTYYVGDYSQRQFERASFNRIIAWDVLNRFPSVEPIVRKMTRELKAGGLLCVRSWVAPVLPEVGWTDHMGAWWSKVTGNTGGPIETAYAGALAAHGPIPSHASAILWAEFQRVIDAHLVIQESIPQHGKVSDVAELVATGHDSYRELLTQLLDSASGEPPATPETARYAVILAANEKQLGKVFSLPD